MPKMPNICLWNCGRNIQKDWRRKGVVIVKETLQGLNQSFWLKSCVNNIYSVVVFVHLDPNFRDVFGLTSGQNSPNFGAKLAQLKKPGNFP